jgi:DNA-binding PadR family transcriptional regulator
MARVNNSYYAILGIISVGPMSGYQIKAWVDKGVGYFWDIDYKQIYPTLKKLVVSGLVTFEVVKSSNIPESKVYRLTDSGMKELQAWLTKPIQEGKQSTPELMLKLFFGHLIPVETSIEHLESFKASKTAILQSLDQISEVLNAETEKDAFWHYRMTTVNRGKLLNKSDVDWCNQTIEYLQNNPRFLYPS